MKKAKVVSCYNWDGYQLYGKDFRDSFAAYWPDKIELQIYTEDPKLLANPDWGYRNLNDVPGYSDFIKRNKDDPIKNGRVDGKYKMIFDAIKFSHKTFAIIDAALKGDADLMFWLDADTITHSQITLDYLVALLPDQYYTAYLGREQNPKPMYSECGFVAYNLRHTLNKSFMNHWRYIYEDNNLFSLKEWHDSYVYDVLRMNFCKASNADLSWTKHLANATTHPFIQVFGDKMDHKKGPRKQQGRSGKHEMVVKSNSPYWNT